MVIRRQRLALTAAAVSVLVFLAACGQGHAEGGGPPGGPAVVQVLAVTPRPLALGEELPGRVEATRVAEVRARVAGIVLRRHFTEGADVKAGQLLFSIDPAPYQAALARARGNLARADATLAEAQAVARRYAPLAKLEAVSQQEYDAAEAAHKNAQAARLAAQADVDTAQLDLDHTRVVAPIAGRIGRGLVTEGALVGQGEATALAQIQQLHPVYVDFSRPAADVLRARGTPAGAEPTRLSVAAEGTSRTLDGRLLFTGTSVDRTTGQIALRGEFANPEALLLPGMYVRVQVHEGTQAAAILVPQRAVKRTNDGKAQVMVLAADGKVVARPVQTGRMVGPDWHITAGLDQGERVIVGGPPVNPGDAATVASDSAPAGAPTGA